MQGRITSKLTFANVVSVVALFVALGAGAYAAFHLPKNSVKSKNIVNGQVKSSDLRRSRFHSIALLPNPGGLQYCTGANNEWTAVTPDSWGPVGYRRDVEGWVHLSGVAQQCGSPAANRIFTLPPGYRPRFSQAETAVDVFNDKFTSVGIGSDGTVLETQPNNLDAPSLAGLSFRCGPSGQDGCP